MLVRVCRNERNKQNLMCVWEVKLLLMLTLVPDTLACPYKSSAFLASMFAYKRATSKSSLKALLNSISLLLNYKSLMMMLFSREKKLKHIIINNQVNINPTI